MLRNGMKRMGLQPQPEAFLLAPCCDSSHSKKLALLHCGCLQKYTRRCERRCILAHADTKQECSNTLASHPLPLLLPLPFPLFFVAQVTDVAFGLDRHRFFILLKLPTAILKFPKFTRQRGSAKSARSV